MKYIGKKLGTLLITLLVISLLVFLAFSIIPGDPALSMLGTDASPERLASLREEMGLNQPLLVRYGKYPVYSFSVILCHIDSQRNGYTKHQNKSHQR